jgi:predicted P-loop ATPase
VEDKIRISVCNHKTDKKYKNQEWKWDDIKKRNSEPIRTSETMKEYPRLPKPERDKLKDQGGFVGGWLNGGIRKNGNVTFRTLGTLDADNIPEGSDFLDKAKSALGRYGYFIYSTHSNAPDNPRYRIVVRFSRTVSEDEYPAVMRMLAHQIGMDFFDDSTYQANRMMYWASCPSDGQFAFLEGDGEALNPDEYLAMYADWRDITQWPTSSRESEAVLHDSATHQADPMTKAGIVGAFCRTYTVQDVMEKFLKGIYVPSAVEGRYDYLPGEGSAGVVVYDDKWAYSHHATDPACGMLLNAFDLVRIHRFGNDDPKRSYSQMAEVASSDEGVKLLLVEERQAQASDDFATGDSNIEWRRRLQYETRSTVLLNNLHNITLILENDEKLRSIVFNQQLDGMEIKGDVPWKHPSKYWRDADDAQLISYVDSHYGTFSQRNYAIAVAKVADDRSYHPIREFFEHLPAWDGILRADTILIRYLGATDNAYVRAVTRKTLCAAVKRIFNPGCKFDTMLVLNGPQGIGKSTLISKLGGEWFSDSLNLGDTKDKTAAEKLQGYWILEIGELAGLRKAEVETLRSFLSRQNDIYRAAFGKRATPHPRQCIFFGTTNAESGYLRDTTGNRRFWPVKTPGGSVVHPWDITSEEIKQIWAEVYEYVKAGETLHLSAELEASAKGEQREALESDEREGLVRDFLETPLPENWDCMDTYERRAFLTDSGFTTPGQKATVKRSRVCNLEIWCEVFGKDRANIKRTDSNELTAILEKLGWVRLPQKERVKCYGAQFVFVPKNVPV